MEDLPASTTSETTRQRPIRRDELLRHELDGEVVLYDPVSGTTYRLNGTAYQLWRACDGSADVDALTHGLTDAYDVDSRSARDDVTETLAQMRRNGLLYDEGDAR